MINEILKQGFYLGLGAAITGQEKMQESVLKLVEKGMLSHSEAESFVADFIKKGEGKKDTWNDEFKNMAKNQLKELGFVTNEELEQLRAQLLILKEEVEWMKIREAAMNKETLDSNDSTEPKIILSTDEGSDFK